MTFAVRSTNPLNADLEANFISALSPVPRSVLDAGCGTGRLAIELYRRGFDTVGVDISSSMLAKARYYAPGLSWRLGDLSCVRLEKRFDAIVLAGNVMLFLRKDTEQLGLRNMALHLAPGGILVTGFVLSMGFLQLEDFDRYARRTGLRLEERYSGWQREAWQYGGNYVVSVHSLR